MTFEQLDLFIAAVEADTFFDAAEKLNTTQSTLSKQIHKLETELGFLFFDRSRRSAVLTPAGEAFYKEAGNLSAHYHDVLRKMSDFKAEAFSGLRIGTLPILTQYGLTGAIHNFIQNHPKISVSLIEAEEHELMAGLNDSTFDFIIARETMIDPALYNFHTIAKDQLSVMLPEEHPLSHRDSLALTDIASEPLILMHSYTSIYQLCMELFKKAGITPHVLRTARMESIISAVRFGEGVSLFPEKNFLTFEHAGLTAVPLTDAPELLVGIACLKGMENEAVIRAFLEVFPSIL